MRDSQKSVKIKEKLFFPTDDYRDELKTSRTIRTIQPSKRRNEIVNYIKDFMTDISISRKFRLRNSRAE